MGLGRSLDTGPYSTYLIKSKMPGSKGNIDIITLLIGINRKQRIFTKKHNILNG